MDAQKLLIGATTAADQIALRTREFSFGRPAVRLARTTSAVHQL
jgi:hypothetical protein